MNKQCPNGHRMRELQSRCSACGWQESEQPKQSKADHRRCAYRYYNDQCPLPGTMSETTRAEQDTEFFCYHHMEHRDNPKKSAFIYHEIMAEKLTGHTGSGVQEMMDKKLAELKVSNPELFYKPETPAESREYQKMMMNYLRNVSFKVSTALPYNKAKTYAEPELTEEQLLTGTTIRTS